MSEKEFWGDKRVCVTGGAGFLGKVVVRKLKDRGAKDVFVPTIEKYDITKLQDINRMLDDAKPDMIIHLGTQEGGIG